MYSRSTMMRFSPTSTDDAIAYLRDEAWPAIRDMRDCVGMSVMCDRESGRCIATSAWADRDAMRATDDRIEPMRRTMAERFGGTDMAVQEWEIAVLHREHPTTEGACARMTWVRTRPGRPDDLVEMYHGRLMPAFRQWAGFCSNSLMIDRDSGRAVGTVSFTDRGSLEASREQSRMLREELASAMVDILDVMEMEVVLAHLRVPETV